MIKISSILSMTLALGLFAASAHAQLPANPWVPQPPAPNDGYFGEDIGNGTGGDIVDSPIYGQGPTNGDIFPVDPWARARDRSGVRTWKEHLRNMGYNIPDTYDQKIKDMPSDYKATLQQSLQDVTANAGDDPLSLMFSNVYNIMEDYTGLDFNNLLFNTMDILGTD